MKPAELWGDRNPPKTTKKPEPSRRAEFRRGLLNFLICWCSFQEEMPPIMGGSEFYLWAGMTPFVPLCQQHRGALFRVMWPALGRACLKRKKEKTQNNVYPAGSSCQSSRHPATPCTGMSAGRPGPPRLCLGLECSRAGSWRGQVRRASA